MDVSHRRINRRVARRHAPESAFFFSHVAKIFDTGSLFFSAADHIWGRIVLLQWFCEKDGERVAITMGSSRQAAILHKRRLTN